MKSSYIYVYISTAKKTKLRHIDLLVPKLKPNNDIPTNMYWDDNQIKVYHLYNVCTGMTTNTHSNHLSTPGISTLYSEHFIFPRKNEALKHQINNFIHCSVVTFQMFSINTFEKKLYEYRYILSNFPRMHSLLPFFS